MKIEWKAEKDFCKKKKKDFYGGIIFFFFFYLLKKDVAYAIALGARVRKRILNVRCQSDIRNPLRYLLITE